MFQFSTETWFKWVCIESEDDAGPAGECGSSCSGGDTQPDSFSAACSWFHISPIRSVNNNKTKRDDGGGIEYFLSKKRNNEKSVSFTFIFKSYISHKELHHSFSTLKARIKHE